MRIMSRSAVVLALAVAGALSLAGIALAAQDPPAVPSFTSAPFNLPGPGGPPVYGPAKVHVHTQTTHSPPGTGPSIKRERFFFDDNFRFKTNAVPVCAPASLNGKDLAQAVAVCGNSLVSVAPSTAQFDTPDTGSGSIPINGCVLVFNGQGAASEVLLLIRLQVMNPSNINCANPATNHQGNVTRVLQGDLKANPNGAPITGPPGDYADPDLCSPPVRNGCQLDINNIDTIMAPFLLTHLILTIQHGAYLQGRCADGNGLMNLQTLFTAPPPAIFVNKSAGCI